MKFYIIAGEASGDLHASNLLKALSKKDPSIQARGIGGDLMTAAGAEIIMHYKDLAFMGFIEVLLNLRTILRGMKTCKKDITQFKPDALILVDYPGFNLPIAKWAHQQGIKVYYYISPQIWAWKAKRVHKIARYTDKVLTILPFEQAFYQKYGYSVDYVGHPLLDVVEGYKSTPLHPDSNKEIIALLPGSRKQEIKRVLPNMLEVSQQFPEYQFIIAAAPSQEIDFYTSILKEKKLASPPQIIQGQTYDLLSQAKAALVTSGTATLETALFRVPQVVCYTGSTISYQIAKRLVNISYISLVNLIADKEVVKELIQEAYTVDNLQLALKEILSDRGRQDMLQEYDVLCQKLGDVGASERTASKIWEDLI